MPRHCSADHRVIAICALVCLVAAPAFAQRHGGGRQSGGAADGGVPGMQQAEIHNPYSSRYVDMLPGGFDRRSAAGSIDFSGSGSQGGFGPSHYRGSFCSSPLFIPYGVPAYGYGNGAYGYGPGLGPYTHGFGYGGFGYGGFGYGAWGYSGWLPPVVLPAETIYGPLAAQRFFGFDQPAAPEWNVNLPQAAPQAGGFGQLAPGHVDPPERGKIRASNAEARARARKYLGYGDEHFRKQRFADAMQRYRSAADAAPDISDAYFRQGFAMAAMGRYETAVKLFERGLDVAPDWPQSGFRIDALYGDNQLAKTAHLEALAKAAAAEPNDADLMFLLGVYLYVDGRPDRARPFFMRARDLGFDDGYLAGFLKAAAAAPGGKPAVDPNGKPARPAGVEI